MGRPPPRKADRGQVLQSDTGSRAERVCPRRPLGYDLEGYVAEPVDGEAHAVAWRGKLGGDAAARHHDHASTEHAAAPVEEVGQPHHRFEGMTEGVARLALAGG